MIQDDIINDLQYIPEDELIKIYNLIHSLRLKFDSEDKKQKDIAGCLKEYANSYIPTEQAKQQAWDAIIDEQYHHS